jgi:hypothetical protein
MAPARQANDRTQPEKDGDFTATFVCERACLERGKRDEFAQLQLEQRKGMPSTLFSEYFWVIQGQAVSHRDRYHFS